MSFPRLLLLCLLVPLAGCSRPAATVRQPVRVFAAASTQQVLNDIKKDFTSTTGVPVECEFAASSTLARQIENGAAADLFLSADEEWADYLERKGLVEKRQTLLTNRLGVIVPAESKLVIKELSDVAGNSVKRLAVAGEAVPAGRYARQALHKAGVWERVIDRLLEGKDVTATLLYVARDEADAGFVYATDAAANNKVRLAYEVPEDFTVPIRYPLVTLCSDKPHPDVARFADYLASDAASNIFLKAGFGIVR